MHTLSSLRANYKDQIMAISSSMGFKSIRVFGSIARGEGREDSDIDFLVETSPGVTYFTLAKFQRLLESLLGCRVDVITDSGLSKLLKPKVELEAVYL